MSPTRDKKFPRPGSNDNTLPLSVPSLVAAHGMSLLPPLSPAMRSDFLRVKDDSTLRPRKTHRRSNTVADELMTPRVCIPEPITRPFGVKNKQIAEKTYDEEMHDLYDSYMRLDNTDSFLQGSSRDSGPNKNESNALGVKSRAGKGIISPSSENASSEISNIAPPCRQQFIEALRAQISGDILADETGKFFISGQSFTTSEIKQIEGDKKLSEMVAEDPKRVKRMLANRVLAARSEERKNRRVFELENKVETLQALNTMLASQVVNIQRVLMHLKNENKELRARAQLLEQHEKLDQDSTNRLTAEVNELNVVADKVSGYRRELESLNMQSQNETMSQQLNINHIQELERRLNSDFESDINLDLILDSEFANLLG